MIFQVFHDLHEPCQYSGCQTFFLSFGDEAAKAAKAAKASRNTIYALYASQCFKQADL